MWLPVKKSGERASIREIAVKKENVECYVNIKKRNQTGTIAHDEGNSKYIDPKNANDYGLKYTSGLLMSRLTECRELLESKENSVVLTVEESLCYGEASPK